MKYTFDLKKISKKDTAIAGGKGASLGEMMKAGIPVPPGFVVLAAAFEKFLEETDLNVEIDSILHTVNHKKIHTVEDASERIQALILNARIPKNIAAEIQNFFKELKAKYVAVRSSATAEDSANTAWAGQLESYLNTTDKNLLGNVKKCWASLFTPRAIFYRFENNLHKHKISVAVVVQKMVESEKSGIAFSVHPVTQDKNQLIIESARGLGEAIVSGQITPDSYVVEKSPRRIIDKNIKEKQILSDKEILKLSEMIIHIENHYGFPVDVEWAVEKGKFYIVQSRPITTLDLKYKNKKVKYAKEFARNYSLFQVIAYAKFNERSTVEFNVKIDTGHPLFVYTGGPLADIYYPEGELKKIFGQFGKMAANADYFHGVVSKFFKVIDEIKPYFYKQKSAKNLEELRYIYELYMDFGYGESAIWVAPLVKNLSKEIKTKALSAREQTQDLTSLRDELFDYNLYKLFPKLGELTHFVLPESVFGGKTINILLQEAAKYRKGFIFFDGNIYTGQQDKILKKLNIELKDSIPTGEINSISGQSTSQGIARGQTKIVLTNKDIHKVLRGDVMVSPMTRPDFILAMKKAAAIITDEGGITCHASIVARELKIPCIVGTKFATQVLKDGDLVEVDANKGVIRKITTLNK